MLDISVDLTIYFDKGRYYSISMVRQYGDFYLWAYTTQSAQPRKSFRIKNTTAKNFIIKYIKSL